MDETLKLDTWENLLKLTGENITEEQLGNILKELKVERLKELSESQANLLITTFSSLPYLRGLLWEGLVESIEREQARSKGQHLSKVDPIVAANLIVPKQLDRIALMMVRQGVQGSLFNRDTEV